MNEARIQRELSHLLGNVGVRRLEDLTLELRDGHAERIIEVSPASAEQTSEVIQFAAREGLRVIPAGARTFVDSGNLMTQADLIMSTRNMNRLLKHEPADLVATAEAGITMRDFQNQLAQAGQWLPIDSAEDGSITLGGAVATGSNGPQSFGHGPLRSFVIGMRAVLAGGRQIKAGGNVVKNVAGYDLCKLFTGSFGTLGIITELTFKLRPLPPETRTIIATGRRESLLHTGRSIVSSFFPVAVELISSQLAQDLALQPKGESVLLVKFAGSSRAVVTQTAQALKVLRDQGLQCSTYDDDEGIWQRLAAACRKTENDLCWLARLRASDLPSFVNEVAALDEASHPGLQWHAGLGDGRVRVLAQGPTYHQQAVRALERLRQKAENLGGSLVVEKASADFKREFDSWGSFGSATELMKRIKQELDPENLLSPGRLFAEIEIV